MSAKVVPPLYPHETVDETVTPVLIIPDVAQLYSSVSKIPSLSSSKSIKSPTPSPSVSKHTFNEFTKAYSAYVEV